ncbi:hypothetical protein AC249_AIPGENE18096 [Exaiptasia diaphana]|nr:hypothetical protein AC249_AIPGENE18096 [Exaiptasia diaphana]
MTRIVATKDQLFQYNGNLYEQKDGVAMGSPLGPLLANSFLCYIHPFNKSRGEKVEQKMSVIAGGPDKRKPPP